MHRIVLTADQDGAGDALSIHDATGIDVAQISELGMVVAQGVWQREPASEGLATYRRGLPFDQSSRT